LAVHTLLKLFEDKKMPFNLLKTGELTSIGRQVLETNREMIGFALDKSQEVATKSVDFNRDILLAGLSAATNSREESVLLYDQLVGQGADAQEWVKELVEQGSEQSKARIEGLFNIAGAHRASLLNNRFFDSVEQLGEPAIKAIQGLTTQLTEVPGKFINLGGSQGTTSAKKAPAPRQPAKKVAAKVADKVSENTAIAG
jgi:hypothetical protein